MKSIGISDIGLARDKNQDYFYQSNNKKFPLFIIADGMGGHKSGEIASRLAVDCIKEVFKYYKEELDSLENIEDVMEKAIYEANKLVYEKAGQDKELEGMGTTVVIAYKFENNLIIGHVGDSRLYVYDEDLKQVTEDHSLVNKLVKDGEITKEESFNHKKKNIITKALGTSQDVVPDINKISIEEDDLVLMCTDGLTDMLEDEKIKIIFDNNEDRDLLDICDKLIEEANDKGGKDNITAIIIKF